MDIWIKFFVEFISFLANIVEILLGGLALFIAFTQKDKISTAFAILLNYSFQTSVADLKHWLEKLEESNFDEEDGSKKIRTALAHIFGKIKGNPTLYRHFGDRMLKRIRVIMQDLDEEKKVTETNKISLYSEIKESLTTLEINNHKLESKKL